MNRTARIVMISALFLCAALSGLVALAASSHSSSGHGQPAPSVAISPSTVTPTPVANPVSVESPTTTITVAAPVVPAAPVQNAPAQNAQNSDPGKPASFWLLKVTYPTYCTLGSTVAPVLSWNAANTVNVAVSIDTPSTVGGYGFFGTVESLTMPSIPCTGTKGDPLPTHEYEIDAFGTNNTRLHLVEQVDITVSPNLTYPSVPVSVLPPIAKQAI